MREAHLTAVRMGHIGGPGIIRADRPHRDRLISWQAEHHVGRLVRVREDGEGGEARRVGSGGEVEQRLQGGRLQHDQHRVAPTAEEEAHGASRQRDAAIEMMIGSAFVVSSSMRLQWEERFFPQQKFSTKMLWLTYVRHLGHNTASLLSLQSWTCHELHLMQCASCVKHARGNKRFGHVVLAYKCIIVELTNARLLGDDIIQLLSSIEAGSRLQCRFLCISCTRILNVAAFRVSRWKKEKNRLLTNCKTFCNAFHLSVVKSHKPQSYWMKLQKEFYSLKVLLQK